MQIVMVAQRAYMYKCYKYIWFMWSHHSDILTDKGKSK